MPPASIEEPLAAASSPLPGLSALAGARPTPAPAKRSPAEVDAYFDRLDEAFATLATAPRPAPVPVPEARAVPPLSLVPPAAPRTPVAPVEPAPAASLAAAFEGLLAPGSASSGPVGPPATPAVEHLPVPPSSPTGETTTVITTTPAAASPTDAAREGGLTDAQVTELADRVLEQLTARLGAKTLPQIVAEVAERLVRAEIDQIKRRV